MSYRFSAECEAFMYRIEGVGTLWSFVTIGTTSDVSKPITNWRGAGWPIEVALPPPLHVVSGGSEVVGEIKVSTGQVAAVGIIFGVIVSLIDGLVEFLGNSNFGTTLYDSNQPGSYGKIEYRFNPDVVIKMVREAMAYQP